MKYTTMMISAIAAAPFVSARQAIVQNNCPQTVCAYTTQPGGGAITNTFTLASGASQAIPYPADGAVGSQVRVAPNCDSNNAIFWEFSVGADIVYYDVNIEGPTTNPFSVRGAGVTGTDASCPAISCEPGSTACFNNPNGVQQNQVKACAAENTITFNACSP